MRLFEMDTNEAKITTWKRVAAAGGGAGGAAAGGAAAGGAAAGDGDGSVVVEKGRVDQQVIVEAGKVVGP